MWYNKKKLLKIRVYALFTILVKKIYFVFVCTYTKYVNVSGKWCLIRSNLCGQILFDEEKMIFGINFFFQIESKNKTKQTQIQQQQKKVKLFAIHQKKKIIFIFAK